MLADCEDDEPFVEIYGKNLSVVTEVLSKNTGNVAQVGITIKPNRTL